MELFYITLGISLLCIILFSIFEDEYTRGEWLKVFGFNLIPILNVCFLVIMVCLIFEKRLNWLKIGLINH